ncbi:MAG: hypothetical protein JSU94_14655 [Phycisphaerales bacterium]|nr:MAG: hypothetical protein JSU94_14655 [Phycisphaerales bacterium]
MSNTDLTLRDIKNSLTEYKSAQDQDRIITLLFRPISFYLTYLLIRAGVSANKTSVLSLSAGLVSVVLLPFSSIQARIAALVCLYIWQLLEYCDGNIARSLGKSSFAGAVIDDLNPLTIKVLMPIGLGIHAFLSSARLLFEYPPEINLVIGFAAGMLYLMARYYSELCNKIFMAYSADSEDRAARAREVSGSSIARRSKCSALYQIYKIAEYLESFGHAGLILTFLLIALNMHLYLLILLLIIRMITFMTSLGRFTYIAVKYSA